VHRFQVPPGDISNGLARVKGDELQHLARVLRLAAGDPVVVFDGQGREYMGVIECLDKTEAVVRVQSSTYCNRESPLEIWLAQGLPKGDKMELIIQKGTELGVRGIVPLVTERAVVKLEGKKKDQRQSRWQKVAVEAAKQCRRTVVPEIISARTIKQFLSGLSRECLVLIPWEEGGQPLKRVLREKEAHFLTAKPVYILIGPEGGLDEKEVGLAQNAGGIPVTLGPRILRTETAGLAVLAAVMYEWGDLG